MLSYLPFNLVLRVYFIYKGVFFILILVIKVKVSLITFYTIIIVFFIIFKTFLCFYFCILQQNKTVSVDLS